VRHRPAQRGDVRDTAADIRTAFLGFGYVPQVTVRKGLAAMIAAEQITSRVPVGATH
jgi:hypothetical protein